MARPPRTVLMETQESDYYNLQITQAPGYWLVVYGDQPFKIVRDHRYLDKFTYSRTGFPEPGHALNLARKLNRQFNTDQFTVRKLI